MSLRLALVLATVGALASPLPALHAQGSAFTYQGRLAVGGVPADGLFDFRFRLALDASGSNWLPHLATAEGVGVAEGLFQATIDFGADAFTGPARWLEISVRSQGDTNYTTLRPLQELTLAPYAAFANAAGGLFGTNLVVLSPGTSNVVASFGSGGAALELNGNLRVNGVLSGSFAGDLAGATNLDASSLASGRLSPDRLNGVTTNQFAVLNSNPYPPGTFQEWTWRDYPIRVYGGNVVPGLANYQAACTCSNIAGGQPWGAAVEFATDSSGIVLKVMSGTPTWRLIVEGVPEYPQVGLNVGLPNDDGIHYLQYPFGSRLRRSFRFESNGSMFVSLIVGKADGVFPPAAIRQKRCIVLGDSFSASFGLATNTGVGPSWLFSCQSYYTNVDFWPSGVGGSGYIASGTLSNFVSRVTNDVIHWYPDAVIVAGGINDPGGSNALYFAASRLYSAIRTSLPGADLIVVGPWWPRTPIDTNLLANYYGIKQAATDAAALFVDDIATPWITGYYTDPGSGNAAAYIGDGTHPSVEGAEYLGQCVADALEQLAPWLDAPKEQRALVLSRPLATGLAAAADGTNFVVDLGQQAPPIYWMSNHVFLAAATNGAPGVLRETTWLLANSSGTDWTLEATTQWFRFASLPITVTNNTACRLRVSGYGLVDTAQTNVVLSVENGAPVPPPTPGPILGGAPH